MRFGTQLGQFLRVSHLLCAKNGINSLLKFPLDYHDEVFENGTRKKTLV